MWHGSHRADDSIMTGAIAVETTPTRAKNLTGAELLAVAADPIRWTLLTQLAGSASCVCNLHARLPIAANLLSYHLKVLREAGLLTASRRGRWIDYAVAPDALDRLRAALPGALTPAPVK